MNKNEYKYKIVFLVLFCSIQITAFSQVKTISGTVTATDSEALPGVSVLIKGTSNGTVTDLDGNYSIDVPDENAILIFSFVGYNPVEFGVTGINTIDVTLEEDLHELDEIVVIGYGTQKKIDKTGAVAQVTSYDFIGGVVTDPIQAIQGKTSGVLITKKGGDPNAGFSVKIRGSSGFDSETSPLFVIDGIVGVDPTTIAPEDIETFNVLKDAASAAIYGSQGSNGVIIITTKKGKEGRTQVNLNTSVSFDWIAKKLELLTSDDLRTFAEENNLNLTDGGGDTDWQDEIYRRAFTQNYNLNFSGGTERSTYYASITHSDWEGVMRGTDKKRTIGKININHKALNDKLTIFGSLSETIEQNDYENYDGYEKDDIIYQALSRNPTDPVYDENGNYYKTERVFNYENPLATINEVDNIRDAKRFFGAFKADLEIFKGFVASTNIGYTRDDHESSYYRPGDLYAVTDPGTASKTYENKSKKLLETTLNYSKFYEKHNITAVAGHSWQEIGFNGFKSSGETTTSEHLSYNNLWSALDVTNASIDSWKGFSRLIGFFGRVQYNYDSKYYLSASYRRDGSTRFGEDNKWGAFPTVAGGWTISREPFMSDLNWINHLKLRLSWGVSGNQEIGEYKSQVLFEPAGLITNPEDGEQIVRYEQPWNANPNLKWEETTETNLGIDFAFIDNKISGSLEIYSKKTSDLLGEYSVPVPPYPAPTIWANSGTIGNNGIELNIQYYALSNTNLKWKTTLNVSKNIQTVVDLGEYDNVGVREEGFLTGRGLIGDLNYVSAIAKNEELGAFYLPVYVGLSGDGKFLYKSQTGGYTRNISDAQREFAGSPLPDLELGWHNSFTIYKNWSCDFSFRAMIGNDVFNATQMFFDYNGNLPDLNTVPEAVDWYNQGRSNSPAVSDYYVEDGSFLRMDYISIGYLFNIKENNYLKTLKLSVASNNLFILTNYSGIDPETSYDGVYFGIDQYDVYPKTRTLTFSINATF